MKLLASEGLMYDPALIECAEFDWFSVRCLEDAPSFTSHIRLTATSLSLCGAEHVHSVCQVVS